jgi:hypothetical protein
VRGALSVAVCARAQGIANLVLPVANAAEAAVVEGVNVYCVRHLAEVLALISRPAGSLPRYRLTTTWTGGLRPGFPRRARQGYRQARSGSRGLRRSQCAADVDGLQRAGFPFRINVEMTGGRSR